MIDSIKISSANVTKPENFSRHCPETLSHYFHKDVAAVHKNFAEEVRLHSFLRKSCQRNIGLVKLA